MELFKNRELFIATNHGKEKVIAPILEKHLWVKCLLPANFNSDQFGTFTGEKERHLSALDTARLKCMAALNGGGTIAIASEGSFGPHPKAFFSYCDEEILFFLDIENQLEIYVSEISLDTNFNAAFINTEESLASFINIVKFPSHGLIIKRNKDDTRDMIKGITDQKLLFQLFEHFCAQYGGAYFETDMRALYNPTRMQVIKKATENLVLKIASCCPDCDAPGFGVTHYKTGLPCSLCGGKTESILSAVSTCQRCKCTHEQMFPYQKQWEDPMYCNYCNP